MISVPPRSNAHCESARLAFKERNFSPPRRAPATYAIRSEVKRRSMPIGFEIDEVKEHRLWFSRFGIVMMIIGVAAIVAHVVGVAFLAWLLVLAGTCQLTHSFVRERWSGLFLNRPSGILCFLTGLLMVSDPAILTRSFAHGCSDCC